MAFESGELITSCANECLPPHLYKGEGALNGGRAGLARHGAKSRIIRGNGANAQRPTLRVRSANPVPSIQCFSKGVGAILLAS